MANSAPEHGLSPRVRGNRPRLPRIRPYERSIPACTGKPSRAAGQTGPATVYPRVYGETDDAGGVSTEDKGLSPRVRGNRLKCLDKCLKVGSIPACTGKPCSAAREEAAAGVYPRVYGETHCHRPRRQHHYGLSPRVRGNHLRGPKGHARAGSIPACTGKPLKGFVIFCSPFACGDPLEIPSVPTSQTEGLVVLHQVDAVGIHDVLRRFAKCTYTLFAHGRRVSPSHDYRALP